MKTYIVKHNGKVVAVKNLGWLLRHSKMITELRFNYGKRRSIDGQLVAKLSDGTIYFCDYSSLEICLGWLNRPVFRGMPFKIVWNFPVADKSSRFSIGDSQYIIMSANPKLVLGL